MSASATIINIALNQAMESLQDVSINNSLADEALFVATTQMDIKEEGNNGGPEVKRYLKAVGLGTGHPWCMAFVYWCVELAAQRLGIKNPLIKTAGVLDQYNRTTLRKLPNRSGGVKPGDIFIIDFGKGAGHTGFVEKISNGIVYTIEGNTNDEGSREGYEVARRERIIGNIKSFIQLP
jgi:hypothetical protein